MHVWAKIIKYVHGRLHLCYSCSSRLSDFPDGLTQPVSPSIFARVISGSQEWRNAWLSLGLTDVLTFPHVWMPNYLTLFSLPTWNGILISILFSSVLRSVCIGSIFNRGQLKLLIISLIEYCSPLLLLSLAMPIWESWDELTALFARKTLNVRRKVDAVRFLWNIYANSPDPLHFLKMENMFLQSRFNQGDFAALQQGNVIFFRTRAYS